MIRSARTSTIISCAGILVMVGTFRDVTSTNGRFKVSICRIMRETATEMSAQINLESGGNVRIISRVRVQLQASHMKAIRLWSSYEKGCKWRNLGVRCVSEREYTSRVSERDKRTESVRKKTKLRKRITGNTLSLA